tara:strand:- start:258 stop:746 length:489 start_codon:yes stop_codon:yes gene_type:complete
MKKIFQFILVFFLIPSISLALLNSCAKPTVVSVVVPGDEKLNCEQLENEVAESQKIKREAEYAKEGTGGNVARMMLFWPAWAKTLHNADVAIMAADDRNYHLVNLMKKKKCKNVDTINAAITSATTSKNNIAEQLKNLNEMYKSGVLTKEEFEMAKKKTLSQ